MCPIHTVTVAVDKYVNSIIYRFGSSVYSWPFKIPYDIL